MTTGTCCLETVPTKPQQYVEMMLDLRTDEQLHQVHQLWYSMTIEEKYLAFDQLKEKQK